MSVLDLEIIVGTYEEFVLGYKIANRGEDNVRFVQSFADHSHRASIRSICTGGKFLASGSADETIYLYDMKARRETGMLLQHSGTVTCLSFTPDGSHLLSGSEDGNIAVFRSGSWQLEKVFPKAHKGEGVTCLSIHPSGKLAMSVGTDAVLRTWNLVKGRQAYATNLGKSRTSNGRAVSCLLWSPGGTMYVISIGTEVSVYDVATASVIYSIQLSKKVTSICFMQETKLFVGDEGGGVTVYNIPKKKQLTAFDAHQHRVKCIAHVDKLDKKYLVTASSSGEVKLWQYKAGNAAELCSMSCDCRITCLVVLREITSKHVATESVKQEIVSTDISSKEESMKPKRIRTDSEGSSENKSVHKKKKKKKKTKLPSELKKSVNRNVVCTSGQKWIVEDI